MFRFHQKHQKGKISLKMRGLRLKICGIRDNITEVAQLRPDYAGFIFYPKSPRYVGEQFVMPATDSNIKKVAVFVNEPLESVFKITRQFNMQFVQLHGGESVSYCHELKNQGIDIIKAFAIDEGFDFEQLKSYESVVDYYLFDTKTSAFGGSGRTFDWNVLKKYSMEKDYFLSGGISMDNLEELSKIDMSKVHALDVNSRFEVKPGLKDVGKLKELKVKVEELNQQLVTSRYTNVKIGKQ